MDYLLHIFVMVSIYIILASSFNLLIGYAGLFALSHAAFFGVGAYATAILAGTYGLPFPLPLLIGILATASLGMIIALPALRIGGDYLVIVTLALQVIVTTVLINWTSLTGGTDGIRGIPRLELFGTVLNSPGKFLPLALVTAVICFAIAWRLGASPFGRALKAMRENEAAVQAVGKNVVAMKLMVFAIASALAAVAGWLYAHYFTFVSAEGFTVELTIYMLAMVIIGGTGNLFGSLVGAIVLVALPEMLKFVDMPPDIADKARNMLYGLLLIVMLRLRPQGLLPESASASSLHAPPERPPVATQAAGAALEGKGLAKRFGGIVAVRDFDISIPPGRITGLIGPNGAGKTTAFNLLTGFLQPNEGEVTYRDRSLRGLKPHQIVRTGVARSFQDLKLFTGMTVLENVLVALPNQRGDNLWYVYFMPWKVRAEERENLGRAMSILEFVGLGERAGDLASDLSYAEEKLLVVARLLATGAEALLFDEPLSGLAPNALAKVMPVFRRLAESGRTLCIIEHNLDVIRELCSQVVFLDEGRKLAEGTPDELMHDPELSERYFK
ncbi:MAG: branched-chain amino acid ABC transporter ATP-binding protein/permease [Pseudomonadota bacterium]|jgi:ABC-type branched-subunit amino acid transport system permease subunit/ABC-type branched-subunit amino acid transport system ATPase component|nr:branched-chain amino acid ABC transporter ATP-binding protein/permease [Pseudomonadota bacterium]